MITAAQGYNLCEGSIQHLLYSQNNQYGGQMISLKERET